MVRTVVMGLWLLATLSFGAACGGTSQGAGLESACPDLACQCTNSGFSYTGRCVDGAKLCQCPTTQPHQLVCDTPSCGGSSDGSSHYGKLYKPVSFCPTSFAGTDTLPETCTSATSEVTDLQLGGFLSFGNTPSTLFVRGNIVSEMSPFCGRSCAELEASLGQDVHCTPGEHGVACRCARPFELVPENVIVIDPQVILLPNGLAPVNALICSASTDINDIIVSASAFTLGLTPTTCEPGRSSCDNGRLVTCGSDGEYGPPETCPAHETCLNGSCQASCKVGSIYCDESGERVCGKEGVKLPSDPGQPCAEGVSCADEQGCLGARRVELGFNLGGGSLDNVKFVGQVLRAEQDATLSGYGLSFTMYETTTIGWHVYEAPEATGPFRPLLDEMESVGPGAGVHEAPELAVPLSKGSYYLLAVTVPPTTIFEAGAPGQPTRFATPLGVIWSREGFADATISVPNLAVVPVALVGSASLLP